MKNLPLMRVMDCFGVASSSAQPAPEAGDRSPAVWPGSFLEVFHDEEPPSLMLVDGMHGHNMGMPGERGCALRLRADSIDPDGWGTDEAL